MAGALACAAAMTVLSSCVEDNAKKIDEAAGAAELAELQKGWANCRKDGRIRLNLQDLRSGGTG